MQIVIDIPKSTYEYIAKLVNAGKEPLGYFERIIMRGIPLPKGHGDLINRDALKISEERHTEMGEYNWNVEHTYYTRYYSVKEIQNAPIIVGMDNEGTE